MVRHDLLLIHNNICVNLTPCDSRTISPRLVFTIRFAEVEYSYEEGDTSAQVCLVGVGELAQQAMATIFSPLRGSATGESVSGTATR